MNVPLTNYTTGSNTASMQPPNSSKQQQQPPQQQQQKQNQQQPGQSQYQQPRMSKELGKSLSDMSKAGSAGSRRKINIGSPPPLKGPPEFTSNFIKTSKYSVINFIPLCLMLQFKRYANIYFLIIAILQSISAISPLNPFSAWAPLIVVIGLSMAREGYEDYQRYKSDVEMNSSKGSVYRAGKFVEVSWGDIIVGDISLIREGETFPADLIVINSSNTGGVCFIETSSLDGEKNYKNKEAMTATLNWVGIDNNQATRILGTVNCIEPNENLHQFEGTISYSGQMVIVGAKQFLLRGAKLRNTKWVIGIVVYTGEDTKIMKNADKSKFKESNIDKETNKCILFIFVFQLCISLASSIGNTIWNSSRNPNLLFIPDPDNTAFEGFLTFLTYLVLNNTMIPISLIVSLELVKLIQGFIIAADEELVQLEDGNMKLPKVFTTSINEELGQVQYVFSDKTGTLTCNKMELKLMCIADGLYGDSKVLGELSLNLRKQLTSNQLNPNKTVQDSSLKSRDDDLVTLLLGRGNFKIQPFNIMDSRTNSKKLFCLESQLDVSKEYFMLLATCHECVIEQKDNEEPPKQQQQLKTQNATNNNLQQSQLQTSGMRDAASNNSLNASGIKPTNNGNMSYLHGLRVDVGSNHTPKAPHNSSSNANVKYQGPSPDEVTLVDTAKQYGYIFLGSTSTQMNVEVHGTKETVELLKLFEFNSDRKRMSVIIRHQGLIKLYIKGADNMIKARLNSAIEQPFLQEIQMKIDEFSKKGLRTLLIAFKILEEEEYAMLEKRYQDAGNAPNREKLFFDIAEDYEKELYLIGATAVEDKLQDKVPETIRDLLMAKINVWMLTGDKMETAENIAKSCKLIQPQFKVLRYEVKRPPLKEGQVYKTPESDILNELKRIHSEKEKLTRLGREKALLIEGEDLGDVLSLPRYQKLLIATVKDCESVVCCRATPKQKAQVVKLVKEHLGKITLAIGDGANDVNMIQEAHIGVGLFGQEGMRAVQASDYALPEFKGLWRLLLVHGRWNYIRISEMILYFFYKNFVFTIPQFFFSFWNGFSGQSIFDDYYITLYNIIFTAFPLIIRAVTEQDMNYKIRERNDLNQETIVTNLNLMKLYPKAYYVGQQNLIFNRKNFFIWVGQAFLHSLIIFLVHSFSISANAMNSDGFSPDIWVYSICIYTSIILVVDFKIMLITKFWTSIFLASIVLTSLGIYFLYVFLANLIESFNVYSTAYAIFSMPNFYLIVFFCVFLVISFDMFIIYLKEVDYKGFVEHLRGIISNKQELNDKDLICRLEIVDITKNQGSHIPDTLPQEKKYHEYAN